MKLIFTPSKSLQVFVFVILLCFQQASAQVCANSDNIIYGLSNAGNLYPVDINTGVVGGQINPPYVGNGPVNPNGIGYNPLNHRFYYFKSVAGPTKQEFVYFDPGLNTIVQLAPCPSSNIIYVGCVTPDGTGYYCWDVKGDFYYYNIMANTWTFITSTIVDNNGADVSKFIKQNSSGDITFDGWGNLMMIPSSNSKYAIYKMSAPLPKTAVASITVTELKAPANPPTIRFVGITLNSTGQFILATASPDNKLYKLQNNMSLTFIATLTMDMADLTSCNFPANVLKTGFQSFSASLKNNMVSLDWAVSFDEPVISYSIERSNNSTTWKKIGEIKVNAGDQNKSFSFNDFVPASGQNLYRIIINKQDGFVKYSAIKRVDILEKASFAVGPNPVQNILQIQNNSQTNKASSVEIFDQAGRKVKHALLSIGLNSITMSELGKGVYTVNVSQADGARTSYKIVKL